MFHYVLDPSLEGEVRHYARRRCRRGECVVYRDPKGRVVAGFANEDRATLFLNLFDDEIEAAFAAEGAQTAA